MYGELDVYLIASLVKRAAARGGVAVVVGPKNGEVGYFPSPNSRNENTRNPNDIIVCLNID